MPTNLQLRRQIRALRHQLSPEERKIAAYQLAEHVAATKLFNKSQHIAFYFANDNEIDLWPLINYAWQQHKTCYFPVLGKRYAPRMSFLPFAPGDQLIKNRYGILEPICKIKRRKRKNWALDLVLTPLVAFDLQGNRLGMGGGYYDRTFEFLRTRCYWRKPHLMGVAYSLQHTKSLKPQAWDIPLDSITTENGSCVINLRINQNKKL